jgi:hypothetical protein
VAGLFSSDASLHSTESNHAALTALTAETGSTEAALATIHTELHGRTTTPDA